MAISGVREVREVIAEREAREVIAEGEASSLEDIIADIIDDMSVVRIAGNVLSAMALIVAAPMLGGVLNSDEQSDRWSRISDSVYGGAYILSIGSVISMIIYMIRYFCCMDAVYQAELRQPSFMLYLKILGAISMYTVSSNFLVGAFLAKFIGSKITFSSPLGACAVSIWLVYTFVHTAAFAENAGSSGMWLTGEVEYDATTENNPELSTAYHDSLYGGLIISGLLNLYSFVEYRSLQNKISSSSLLVSADSADSSDSYGSAGNLEQPISKSSAGHGDDLGNKVDNTGTTAGQSRRAKHPVEIELTKVKSLSDAGRYAFRESFCVRRRRVAGAAAERSKEPHYVLGVSTPPGGVRL